MICVSLGRTSHSAVLREHQTLAEKKAELVELRLDWLRKRPDLGRLLKDRPTPVVVTCRRPDDRGRWSGSEEQRLALLREAIISGAEYVDLEDDVAAAVPRYGKTQRIVSHHNFEETPADLFDIYRRLEGRDSDVIKIVTMANCPEDNVRMLEMVEAADVPTVGFCMGEYGTISRLLCGRYGSPFTYAGFSSDRELAPGQLSWAQVRNLYGFNRITPETRLLGVIGDPIAHSRSPLLHNAALRKAGVNAVYLPLRIPADLLQSTLEQYARLGFSGFSVTIPHKEQVLQFADVIDGQSDSIGAANTLYLRDQEWHTANTDAGAALSAIRDGLAGVPGEKEIAGRRALILGAGGVARAVAQVLSEAGAALVITNRSRDRGRQLAEEVGCQFVLWENRGSENPEILINCTSVGMTPKMNETPFEQHWLSDHTLVFDTVYTPENTLLLKQARERGCPTVSGITMFTRQAAQQFELFTGQQASVDYLEETLRRSMAVTRG